MAYLFLILVLATVRAVGDRLTTPHTIYAGMAWAMLMEMGFFVRPRPFLDPRACHCQGGGGPPNNPHIISGGMAWAMFMEMGFVGTSLWLLLCAVITFLVSGLLHWAQMTSSAWAAWRRISPLELGGSHACSPAAAAAAGRRLSPAAPACHPRNSV